MKQLALLLIASITLASCGNKPPSELNNVQQQGLKGKVKSRIKTFYYSCEYDGESWKPTDNSGYYKTGIYFDENGFTTQTSAARYYPTLDTAEWSSSYTLRTISKGNNITVYTVTWQDSLGKTITDTLNAVWLNNHIRLEYRNNEHGDTLSSYLTKYDNDNREVLNKEKRIQNDDHYITSVSKYFYNKDGVKIKDSIFSNMDNEQEAFEVIYKDISTDKQGNNIYEFVERHGNGDTSRMITTTAIEYYN